MLHGLANTGEGMTGGMRRARSVLSVARGLVRSPVALAQFGQAGERVATRLTSSMVGTCLYYAAELAYMPFDSHFAPAPRA